MRRSPKSPGSASSGRPDAFALAIRWLGQRELSEAQLRDRLARSGCEADAIDAVLTQLRGDHTVDDVRVARAVARQESAVRHRGPARVRQRLFGLGLAPDVVDQAVAEAFADVDQVAMLEAAIGRRLRGQVLATLDEKARARLGRALIRQGFEPGEVIKRVKS